MQKPRIARVVAAAALVGVTMLPIAQATAAPDETKAASAASSSQISDFPIRIGPLSLGPWP
ncbi:hypothetical protein GCM10009785_05850 [Brooklawnia cerclae]|uniref:Uncharacterized protein n=1 Tax=Brooklawnia cerclae TaxID=349934 RepID=A0ABX0SGL1_9ACTN|nr:hypothetical protein [Brooklawnia cerclae]